jgi:hypothetical protein
MAKEWNSSRLVEALMAAGTKGMTKSDLKEEIPLPIRSKSTSILSELRSAGSIQGPFKKRSGYYFAPQFAPTRAQAEGLIEKLLRDAGLRLTTKTDLSARATGFLQVFFTADKICNIVRAEGSSDSSKVSGDAKAQLSGFLAGIGISGGGSHNVDHYAGLLRQDLPTAFGDNAACKLRVFETLQQKMIIVQGGTSTQPALQLDATQSKRDPLDIFDGVWVSVTPPGLHIMFNKGGLNTREASLPTLGQASIRLSDGNMGSNVKISGEGFDCYYYVFKINTRDMIWEFKGGAAICPRSAHWEKDYPKSY